MVPAGFTAAPLVRLGRDSDDCYGRGDVFLRAAGACARFIHDVPAKLGLDIQQTAEGFSISKSIEGRTQFTVSASKAVQFKEGGRADLHNVKIVIYGKDASRFDQVTGDDFEYDPTCRAM
jgi:lipopolysaccharide export system protein LptA